MFVIHAIFSFIGLTAMGMAVGSFGTFVGGGGGLILVPLLLLLYPKANPHELTTISLACVLLNSVSGTTAYARMKRIDYDSGVLFAAATMPGAILGSLTTAIISHSFFEGLFAVFLIVLAVYMVREQDFGSHFIPSWLTSPAGAKKTYMMLSSNGMTFEYDYDTVLGMKVFFVLGFVANFMGIGGGTIIVPALIYVLNFPILIATGTAQFMIAILSFTGTTVHFLMGAFHDGGGLLFNIIAIGGGMVIGAPYGARFSKRVKDVWIVRSLAAAMLLVGLRMIFAVL